jgi:hypothetical protein
MAESGVKLIDKLKKIVRIIIVNPFNLFLFYKYLIKGGIYEKVCLFVGTVAHCLILDWWMWWKRRGR